MQTLKQFIGALTLVTMIGVTSNAQSVAPVIVPGDNYAFAYSSNGLPSGLTPFGLYFNETGSLPGFEFRGAGGAKLVNVQSIPSPGREPGDITFGSTGSLIVGPNRYAFRFSLTNTYGLFFNAADFQYEFRTADASPVLMIHTENGEVIAVGAMIGNGSFLSGSFGTKGIGGNGPTNGYLGVQGATSFDGEDSLDIDSQEIGVLGISTGGSSSDNTGVYGFSNDVAVRAVHKINDNEVSLATRFNAIEATGNSELTGELTITSNLYNDSTTKGPLRLNNTFGSGIALDNNEIQTYSSATTAGGTLFLNFFGGNVDICNTSGGDGDLTVHGGTLHVDGLDNEVGIGTTIPTARLQVGDSDELRTHIKIAAGGINQSPALVRKTSGIQLRHFDNQNWGFSIESQEDTAYAALIFKSHSSDPLGVERMRIDRSTGNVGIGTFTPTNKLDVRGKISISQIPDDEMVILNSEIWEHNEGVQTFGVGGDPFIMASKEGSFESSGVFGDGNNLTFWSPGDGAPGQPSAVAYFLDEDRWNDGDGNPYNSAGSGNPLIAYLNNAGVWLASDSNVKQNIQPMEQALDKITQISGFTYEYKLAPSEIEKGQKPQKVAGVIAQELIEVLPEAVDQNIYGQHFVNYNGIIPLLVESVKELDSKINEIPGSPDQNEKIEKLEQENETMKNELAQIKQLLSQFDISLDECCANHHKGNNGTDLILDKASLGQNIPNPFGQTTIIPFYIPDGVSNVYIQVSDLNGKLFHEQQVDQNGVGNIEISGSQLAKGTYVYSLIIDDKVIDSKRMVLN